MQKLTDDSLVIAIMSFNRGPYLRHAVESAFRHAPKCRVLIVDDASDDPATVNCLNAAAAGGATVVVNKAKRLNHFSGSYLGGLYVNMNVALDVARQRGKDFVLLMQDDQQLVRDLDDDTLAGIDRIFSSDEGICQVNPTFFKGVYTTERLAARFGVDQDLGYYFEKSASGGIGDTGIVSLARLAEKQFRFAEGERQSGERALAAGLRTAFYRDPLIMYMPWPHTTRDAAEFVHRYRLGPHPYEPMSDAATQRLKSRPAGAFPIAEEYLETRDALRKPWWYTALNEANIVELMVMTEQLRAAGEASRISGDHAAEDKAALLSALHRIDLPSAWAGNKIQIAAIALLYAENTVSPQPDGTWVLAHPNAVRTVIRRWIMNHSHFELALASRLLDSTVLAKDVFYLAGKAAALFSCGMRDEVRRCLYDLVDNHKDNLHLIWEGFSSFKEQDGRRLPGIVTLYSEVVIERGDPAHLYNAAATLMASDYGERLARRLLEVAPTSDNHVVLARCLTRLQRKREGIAVLEALLERDPDHWLALNDVINWLHETDQPEKARAYEARFAQAKRSDGDSMGLLEMPEHNMVGFYRAEAKAQEGTWHKDARLRFYPKEVHPGGGFRDIIARFLFHDAPDREPPFSSDSKLLTFGSCFASHLRRHLARMGKVVDNVQVPEELNNTWALYSFVSWALTGDDAYLSYGYLNPDAVYTPPFDRQAFEDAMRAADGFVFTVGVGEIWRDLQTGQVFWKGVPESLYDPARHQHGISSVEENADNMIRLCAILRERFPEKPIVLTVSPVPLRATFRDMSCAEADCVSKSVLRAAVDRTVASGIPGVYYWPSFEIVRWLGGHLDLAFLGQGQLGRLGPRHVPMYLVEAIIAEFVDRFFAKPAS